MRDNWLWEVFESSPVAFNIQDEDGVLVMVNAAYCTLTGAPGRTCWAGHRGCSPTPRTY